MAEENDLLDDTIVPDPEDPGEEYALVDVEEFDDEPVDPDADESPDVEGIDAEDPEGTDE